MANLKKRLYHNSTSLICHQRAPHLWGFQFGSFVVRFMHSHVVYTLCARMSIILFCLEWTLFQNPIQRKRNQPHHFIARYTSQKAQIIQYDIRCVQTLYFLCCGLSVAMGKIKTVLYLYHIIAHNEMDDFTERKNIIEYYTK